MDKQFFRPKKIKENCDELKSKKQFPEIPIGYNPKGLSRAIFPTDDMPQVIEIDGFIIRNEIEEYEEPIFGSREKVAPFADGTKNGAFCSVCDSYFKKMEDAVFHINQKHGGHGDIQNTVLDTTSLVEAGYLRVFVNDGLSSTSSCDKDKNNQ